MKSKKLICLLLALALMLALAACSKTREDDTPEPDSPEGQTPSEPGDGEDGDGEGDAFDYSVFSAGLDENGYFTGVKALDHVTLPDLDTLKAPEFAKLTDRAVEDGDFVNIDYVGSVDGVEFDGGSTQGAGSDVVIGFTSFIDDFLEQVIGHKPGENFDIEVTFPDPYQNNEDLAGKDAVFNITVNYIWDVTDDAAKAIGFGSRDEMAQYVASSFTPVESVVSEADVTVFLTAAGCDEIPDSVHETVKAQLGALLELQASQYGLDTDTMASYLSGASSADEYLEAQAANQSKWYLVFQALAEQEGITVTDEDITEHEYETYVDIYGRPYVVYTLIQEKAIALINERLG